MTIFYLIFSNEFQINVINSVKVFPSLELLKSIYQAIGEIKDTKFAEEILEDDLIKRLDHVTYGCCCEYPDEFKSQVEPTYNEFRLRFKLEFKPIKSAYM